MLIPVFGAPFLLLAVYTWAVNPQEKAFAESMSAVAMMMFVLSIVVIVRRRSFHVTLSVGDQAVTVNGTELRFERIDSVGYKERWLPAYGYTGNHTWRTLVITAEGKTRSHTWLGGTNDPVHAVVQLVADRMADEARRRTIHGAGWSLEQTTLRIKGHAVPLSTVSAGVFDREVRLWRSGEGSPFFTTPAGSANALVLLRVAGDAARRASATSPPGPAIATGGTDLGRLLFTRKPSGVMDAIAAIVGPYVCTAIVWYVVGRYVSLLMPMLVAAGVVAAYLLLRALHSFTVRYRFYERGVVASALFAGTREVLYGDVRGMKWHQTRRFLRGIYTGTITRARLVPAQGPPLRIRARHYRTPDDDLDRVRDIIAASLADGLQRQMQSDGRVRWTRDVMLLPEGVQLKTGTIVRYDEPVNVRFGRDYLYFHRGGSRRLRVLPYADENFFPGYELYRRLAKKIPYTA